MKEYFSQYAESLGHSLRSIDNILKFTNNTEVVGEYTEKLVFEFISKFISPLNICSGTIISPEGFENVKTPQLDLIFYQANPLPPIFQFHDFGIVPLRSVFGVMEIKRTDYSKGLSNIATKKTEFENYISDKHLNFKPDFLGLICVYTEQHKLDGNNKLTELIEDNSVIYLLHKKEDKIEVNHEGVLKLINYVGQIRKLNKDYGNEVILNLDEINN